MKTGSPEDSKPVAFNLAAIHSATTIFNRYPDFRYMGLNRHLDS
jgi:hypothetical protein